MKNLMATIADATPTLGDWCSVQKAQTLAAIVIATRPDISCEVGVWMGASLIPIALAHKFIGHGKVIAIDAWDRNASVEHLKTEADRQWWASVDHEAAYQAFVAAIHKHELQSFIHIFRQHSKNYEPPDNIGLWHCDGDHNEQAIGDVEKFAPKISLGGFAVMDDLQWNGGLVSEAASRLVAHGFKEKFKIGTGAAYQRLYQ